MDVVVEARQLGYCLNGHQLVSEIDLQIYGGEIYAFFGPRQSGKTSLLKILYGDLNASQGELFLFGLNVRQNWEKIRGQVAMVPQADQFDYELTVFDNLLTYAGYLEIETSIAERRIVELLRSLDLDDHGDDPVDELTSGQRRRLALARALLHEPKLLMFDEPTRRLSLRESQTIWSYLLGLRKQGMTILFTTNRADEVEALALRATLLKDGKGVLSDRVETIRNDVAGSSVVEFNCKSSDVPYFIAKLRGRYEFYVINNNFLVFLRPGQDPREIFGYVVSDQLSLRRTTINDVYQKAVSDWEMSA